MTENILETTNRNPVGWYEEIIPIRGCKLSLAHVKDAYRDLDTINRRYGEQIVSTLPPKPDMSEEEWGKYKAYLLDDAFRLTITVNGLHDQQLYGETVNLFDDPNLPKPIKSIFFTNVVSFRRHANGNEPANRISVFLDFGKPELFDPNPLVSAATPNESNVKINAEDITFFNAVQRAVEKKLTTHKAWSSAIHRNFAYDIGMWLVALPLSLYFSAYYMDQLIPLGTKFELFRWPLFTYLVGISVLLYRALTAYTKWAFPVNVLEENKDRGLKHRIALGGIISWLFYMVASTVFGTIFS